MCEREGSGTSGSGGDLGGGFVGVDGELGDLGVLHPLHCGGEHPCVVPLPLHEYLLRRVPICK